jgi:hypothetical protein
MEITFTLNSLYTGATYVAGPFDISGTTCDGSTYWLVTGATKAQLATGVTINTIYDNISGGTITSGGECAGTTQAWQTGIICPSSGVELQVYAKDINTFTPQNATVTYSINGGFAVNMVTLEPLPSNCGLIYTITGLSLNDSVVISSVDGYPLAGNGTSTCPNSVGGVSQYTHTVQASSGFDYASIAIDSGNPF